MNTIKLFNPLLIIFIICTLTVSCVEDPLSEQGEIELSVSGAPLQGNDPTPPEIDLTQLECWYIEWNPRIFTAHRDQIRASFSDPNGIVYLHDYEVCHINPNLEKWRIIINMINPDDQTPPPMVILMDTEDEMERAESYNFSICQF